MPYIGSHKKIAAYNSIANDGRQLFWTYEKFNAPTFVKYLGGLHRHFGNMLVIMDEASPPPFKSCEEVSAKAQGRKDAALSCGSAGPEHVEECGHRAKRELRCQSTTSQ